MTTSESGQRPQRRTGAGRQEVRLHVMVMHTSGVRAEELTHFARDVIDGALPVLAASTELPWVPDLSPPTRVEGDGPRQGADFLDTALLQLVEAPADAVVVVTDAPLLSTRHRLVPGLSSPSADVVVLSTAQLLEEEPGSRVRELGDRAVRANGATLLVHLLGHLLHLGHDTAGVMRPFAFDEQRVDVEPLAVPPQALSAGVSELREAGREEATTWRRVVAETAMAARRPRSAFAPALRSRAPLLPFRLGRLTAAAIVPVFIVLFTEEFWFVASHLDRYRVWLVAAIAVVGGTAFMLVAQRLLFPRRDRTTVTRHVALTNAAVTVNTFLLMLGLIVTVTAIVLLIQLLLFPSDYIQEWFEQRYVITVADHFYLALVVGSVATVTGALGGSFHGRAVLREYGLFLDEP